MPFNSKAKILVIRGGAIGDFILTLPALTALRSRFPEVQLEVLGYAHIAQLAIAGGVVDAVRSIEAATLAPFFARHGQLPDAMRDYLDGFAIIISYLYDPDEIFRDNVGRCTKAQFIQGPHRPDETAGRHATEVFLEPLQRLAIFDADPIPRLRLSPPSQSTSDRLALHPGSGSERKNWPESKWAELLGRLNPAAAGNKSILLVGGEAEAERLQRLSRHARGPVEMALNQPLPKLAAQLAGCGFFLGHDSGITHLAAAVDLSGLVLWGETAEAVWRPRSERMQLLRAGGKLRELSVDEVMSELSRHARPAGGVG